MVRLVDMVLMEEAMLREVARVEVAAEDRMEGQDKVLVLALGMGRLVDMVLMVVDMLKPVAKVVGVEEVVQVAVDMEAAQGVGPGVLAVATHRTF